MKFVINKSTVSSFYKENKSAKTVFNETAFKNV